MGGHAAVSPPVANDPKQTLALTRQGKISYDAMVDHAANATFRMVRQIAQTPSPDE